MSKSNYDHLRELVKDSPFEEEANEFISAIESVQPSAEFQKQLNAAVKERDELQERLDEYGDPESYDVVDLGLDIMYVKLEHGNLRIQSQLEAWINQVKKQNCAGVEMAGSLF